MADVNGVNQNQEVRFGQVVDAESKPQAAVQAQPNSVVTTKVDSTGVGTQVQTGTNFNLYGADIANFEKFKGNDKHDAMRITTTAANDVKRAYMQLQHEFPDAVIAFEPMPDPKTCGKKREGFFNYQMLLENWKNEALQKIADARETSTRDMGNEIMANDDKNAAMNAGVTVGVGEVVSQTVKDEGEATREAVKQDGDETRAGVRKEGARTRNAVHNEGVRTRNAVHREGAATRSAVRYEGAATRNTVRQEGARTRSAVHQEGIATRSAVHNEGEATRETVSYEGTQTREKVQAEADRVIDTLDPLHIDRAVKSVRDMASRAGKSVGDFIKDNPEVMIPGIGVPIWAAGRLFK